MLLGAGFKSGDGFGRGVVGAMGAPCRHVLERLGKVAVDRNFRGEGDFAVLDGRLQQVTNSDVRLLADALRDDDLKFVLYRDEFHGSAYASTSSIVQLLNH